MDRWFEDESKNEFKIDRNVPTRNGGEEMRNEFITTVDELVGGYEEVYRGRESPYRRSVGHTGISCAALRLLEYGQ